MTRFQPPRGTQDILPSDMAYFKAVVGHLRDIYALYGYGELHTPAFESQELLAAKGGNQIKDEILVKVQKVKGSHEEMFKTLLSQVQRESVDELALNQLFEEKEPEFKEMRSFLIAKFAEFHGILEPGQRVKLAELMKKLHRKKHH